MREWLRKTNRRHPAFVSVLLNSAVLISIGLWLNTLASTDFVAKRARDGLWTALRGLGWHHLWLAILLLALALLEVSKRTRVPRGQAQRAIEAFLRAAAQAYVSPDGWEDRQIRALCHRANPKTKRLEPMAFAAAHAHDDANSSVPYEGREAKPFVIAKAFQDGAVRWGDLVERTLIEEKLQIWPGLRSVVAAPIRRPGKPSEILGTVCFDSSMTVAEAQFDQDSARDILTFTAEAIAELLES